MKFQSFVAAGVLAVAALASPRSVDAADCTQAQLDTATGDDDPEFQKACPALFTGSKETLDLSDISSFDMSQLTALSGCKDKACTTYLTNITTAAPDCEVLGVNVRATYQASLSLCEKFAAGPVTEADFEAIFKDLIANITSAIENTLAGSTMDGMDGMVGGSSDGSVSGNDTATTMQPAVTSEPGATNAVPSPSSTTSTASTAVLATAATVAVAVASAFAL